MMYDGNGGWVWMTFIPVIWLALIGLTVWVVIRLTQGPSGHDHGRNRRETPDEILDRRYASGEIDTQTYTEAREHLAGHGRRT
jgi:putative membrane protein